MQKGLRSEIINFWLVVYGLSQFLARVNSCRKIFGSWWLVVVVVINVLVRGACGGSWSVVVACGGFCAVSDSIEKVNDGFQHKLSVLFRKSEEPTPADFHFLSQWVNLCDSFFFSILAFVQSLAL